MPEKLAELVDLWWREAEEHGVLPLDDRRVELFGARFRDRSPHRADRQYTLPPAAVAVAGPGRGRDRRAQLGPGRRDRPTRRRRGRAVRDRHRELRARCSSRTTDWSSTTTSSASTPSSSRPATVPDGRRSSACGSGGSSEGGAATLVIDGDDCGTVELPTIMRIISSLGSSVGLRPRVAGERRTTATSSRSRDGWSASTCNSCRSARPDTAAAEARAIMGRQ